MHAETRMYEVEIVSNRRSIRYGELKSNFAHTAHHARKIDEIGKGKFINCTLVHLVIKFILIIAWVIRAKLTQGNGRGTCCWIT